MNKSVCLLFNNSLSIKLRYKEYLECKLATKNDGFANEGGKRA